VKKYLFLFVAALFVFSGCSDNGVTYKGKPMTYWINMLQSKDVKKKKEAILACRQIGAHAKKAAPYLQAALKDDHHQVRTDAARALGEIRSKKSIEHLIKASKDKHENVRIAAVQALGEIESKKAVPALIQALKDKSAQVRIYAANGLGDIAHAGRRKTAVLGNQDIDAARRSGASLRYHAILSIR